MPTTRAYSEQRRRPARRGAALIEYALVLALLIGGALLAARQLSRVSNGAFGQVADATGSRASTAAGRTPRPARSAQHRPRWQETVEAVDYRLGIGLVAAGGLGLGLSAALRLRKRRGPAPEAPPEPAAAPLCQLSSVFEKRQRILRVLSKEQRLSADCIQIHHVMTHDVVSIEPQATIAQLQELMKGKRLRHLLVCDARGLLHGVVSDRDLATRRGKTAAEIMSAHPVTVTPESLVVPSITWMINQHISCLPVVRDQRVVGVVTTTDLLLTLQCSLQLLEHSDDDAARAAANAAPLAADC